MFGSIVAISVGAALGALLRWVLAVRFNPLHWGVPLGTLAANLIGGYLIGVFVAWLGPRPELPPQLRLFLITGLMGGLTTFSTFSAEVVERLESGHFAWALTLALTHVAGSLALTTLGLWTVRWLAR